MQNGYKIFSYSIHITRMSVDYIKRKDFNPGRKTTFLQYGVPKGKKAFIDINKRSNWYDFVRNDVNFEEEAPMPRGTFEIPLIDDQQGVFMSPEEQAAQMADIARRAQKKELLLPKLSAIGTPVIKMGKWDTIPYTFEEVIKNRVLWPFAMEYLTKISPSVFGSTPEYNYMLQTLTQAQGNIQQQQAGIVGVPPVAVGGPAAAAIDVNDLAQKVADALGVAATPGAAGWFPNIFGGPVTPAGPTLADIQTILQQMQNNPGAFAQVNNVANQVAALQQKINDMDAGLITAAPGTKKTIEEHLENVQLKLEAFIKAKFDDLKKKNP